MLYFIGWVENFPGKVLTQLLPKLSYLFEVSSGSYLPSKTLPTSNLITNENKRKRPIAREKENLWQVTWWLASDRCITVPKALINKWDMLNSTSKGSWELHHTQQNQTSEGGKKKKTKPNKTNSKCSFTLQLNPLHTVACFLLEY